MQPGGILLHLYEKNIFKAFEYVFKKRIKHKKYFKFSGNGIYSASFVEEKLKMICGGRCEQKMCFAIPSNEGFAQFLRWKPISHEGWSVQDIRL